MKRQLLKQLLSLFRSFRGGLVLLLVLGGAASVGGGMGIGLLIPLIASMSDSLASISREYWPFAAIQRMLAGMSRPQQLGTLSALILLAIGIRTALFFGHSLVTRWLDSRITHKL